MSIDPSAYAHERLCDLCGQLRPLDALLPGWEVVRVDGEPKWSCPHCTRERARAEGRDGWVLPPPQ